MKHVFGSTVALVVVSGLIILLGMGCPPDNEDTLKVVLKAMKANGCEGCTGCEPQEGESEGETDPEITLLLPGEVPLTLLRIPAGSFQMGSPEAERNREDAEGPVHTVAIDPFYISKYEVTQRQWLAVMGAWPGPEPSEGYGLGDAYPAYHISWEDAQDFVVALNAYIRQTDQCSLILRLPSEAEWEYACRAETQTRFFFGDSLDVADFCEDDGLRTQYMHYCGNNSPNGSKPVGGVLANAFGLYDMSGNIVEWCEDNWHTRYTGAPDDGSAWVDSPAGSGRVCRSGSWSGAAWGCRSASRTYALQGNRYISTGFRIAG